MKTKQFLAGLAIACAGSSAMAQNGDYMNGQLAIANIDGLSDGLSVVATYGRPMPTVHKYFALEGEVSASVSDPDTNHPVFGNISVSYYSIAGYGVLTYPLDNKINLRGKAGLLYSHVKVSSSGYLWRVDDGLDLSLGIGVTIALQPKLNMIIEYTDINSDITHMSAGVQYKF